MLDPFLCTPGMRIKLMALSSAKSKFNTRIIGCKTKQFIITEHPLVGGVAAPIQLNTEWMASLIKDGDIYRFNSRVIYMARQPIPLLFLSYPAEVEKNELRGSKRYPVNIPVSCRQIVDGRPAEGEGVGGLMQDLSIGGGLMVARSGFDIGALLDLRMEVTYPHPIRRLIAEVMSCQNRADTLFMVGLSFSPSYTTDYYGEFETFMEKLESLPLKL